MQAQHQDPHGFRRRASPRGTMAWRVQHSPFFCPPAPGMSRWLASHAEMEETAEQKVEQPQVKPMGCSP